MCPYIRFKINNIANPHLHMEQYIRKNRKVLRIYIGTVIDCLAAPLKCASRILFDFENKIKMRSVSGFHVEKIVSLPNEFMS